MISIPSSSRRTGMAVRACTTVAVLVAMSLHAAGPVHAQPAPVPDMDASTRAILESLRVNDSRPNTAQPARDRATHMVAGTPENIVLPMGGSRTLVLPGAFEKAIVVTPEVADVIVLSPGRVQVIARQAGNTDVVFTQANGSTFKAYVSVTLNSGPLQAALNAALPGERIIATSANGSVILTGTTKDAITSATAVNIARRFVADAQNGVVNNIQVQGGQQVMLQVRVAEVNRTVIKQLGLNTSVTGSNGTTFGNAPLNSAYQSGAATSTLNALGGVQPLLALGAATNPIGFVSSKAFGSLFTVVASALESEGLVRTLAEPNLVTQSGKTANMLAGAQYPVPSISQSGRLGTEYRNFGVSLGFTPTVNSANSISLDIATEVSTKAENVTFPDGVGGNFNIPVFNTRKANTTVELPSGGSIVIAGLVSSDFQNTLSGIPGLKDIPILGKLFSSSDFQRHESELVISVTAIMVKPGAVSSPTEGLSPPTDADMYFLNRLTGTVVRRPPPPGASRTFGYITE